MLDTIITKNTSLQVMIDLTETNLDLEPEDLEKLSRNLALELKDLVDDAGLVRESEIPYGSKPALGGFIPGMVKAVVSVVDIKVLLNFLGDRFYGQPLKLEFAANGKSYKLEYRNQQQLEDAVLAIERLSKLT